MLRTMARAKLHGCTITEADLRYTGSITIDKRLMDAADLLPGEMVQVVCMENGARFETYAIAGESDSGIIALNGPAARQALVGDSVHIIVWAQMEDAEAHTHEMIVVQVGRDNRIAGVKREVPSA
jgi:aspartate 1-decarboxylase